MFQTKKFWIVLVMLSLGGIAFSFKFFSSAFPVVNIELKMDREEALERAQILGDRYGWGPENARQVAMFAHDDSAQNFIELEAGGNKAIEEVLKSDFYHLYAWSIRRFAEGEANECHIYFAPDGRLLGFSEHLPENEPGAALAQKTAQNLAEKIAAGIFSIQFNNFVLVESSKNTQSTGRIDYNFEYELLDHKVGKGSYRIAIEMSGNRLTRFKPFIWAPESFDLRYSEMRSSNSLFSNIANILLMTLYGFGGCVIGLILLFRAGWLKWRGALFWGFLISLLSVASRVNYWSLNWFDYDTAVPAVDFIIEQVMGLISSFIYGAAAMTVIVVAAESLTRKAFPKHIQFWKLWSLGTGGSDSVLGRTVAGYIVLGIEFAYVVVIYYFCRQIFGWWTPANTIFEPNVLASTFPWFTAISSSLEAGFVEECLFRAVPLAGAALIGQKTGQRRLCIGIALLVQAFIFGAAHANYPAQPAYARVVELMIPSIIYGLVFIRFGLLPVIIAHFIYDVVWFAMPLFTSSSALITDRIMVVLVALIPFWVVIGQRLIAGRWRNVGLRELNGSWRPVLKRNRSYEIPVIDHCRQLGAKMVGLLVVLGMLGGIIWINLSDFQNTGMTFTKSRSEIELIANETLHKKGITLSDAWQVSSHVLVDYSGYEFVQKEGDRKAFEQLRERYIQTTYWEVTFLKFAGDLSARSENYFITLNGNGEVMRFKHHLPEEASGKQLLEADARKIAESYLKNDTGLSITDLEEVSAHSQKLPNRLDWCFQYRARTGFPLSTGEARTTVEIAGDEVVDGYSYIHVPEHWERDQRKKSLPFISLRKLNSIFYSAIACIGFLFAVLNWVRGRFSKPVFFTALGGQFLLSNLTFINHWQDRMHFLSPTKPISHQLFSSIAYSQFQSIVYAFILAFFAGAFFSFGAKRITVSNLKQPLIGLTLGVIIAAFAAIKSHFIPMTGPVFANYGNLNSFLPALSMVLGSLHGYIMKTVSLIVFFAVVDRITSHWTRHRVVVSVIMITMFTLRTIVSVEAFDFRIVIGIGYGVCFLFAYYFIFRYSKESIPYYALVFPVLDCLKEVWFSAYQGAVTGAIGSILVCLICALMIDRRFSIEQFGKRWTDLKHQLDATSGLVKNIKAGYKPAKSA